MPSSIPTSLPSTNTNTNTTTPSNTPPNPPPISPPPLSEAEIYTVAKVAYSKLVSETSLKDQNLRRLVGHANLYDKLLDDFNNSFFSDSGSDLDLDPDTSDPESEPDADEPPTRSYTATLRANSKPPRQTRIHEDAAYTYRDRHPAAGEECADVLTIEEVEDVVLCKVASHSEDWNLCMLGRAGGAEVEVRELEGVFDV